MIDDQNFEKAIRTKLVQHESDVPDAMWSGIESRLLKRVPTKYPSIVVSCGIRPLQSLWVLSLRWLYGNIRIKKYPHLSLLMRITQAPTITQPSISNLHSSIEPPSVETPKFLPVSSHQSQSQTKQETQTDSKLKSSKRIK